MVIHNYRFLLELTCLFLFQFDNIDITAHLVISDSGVPVIRS